MNFSQANLVSIKEILADVLVNVNDESARELSFGFYERQVRKGLEELSFDTYFNEVFTDLDIPTTLNLPIPKNMWEIKDIFIYKKDNSDCTEDTCDNCNIKDAVRVFYKRNYLSKGKGYGYTSRIMENNSSDPFMYSLGAAYNLYWYNVNQGIIMLSDLCKDYDKIRIVANGLLASDINEAKIIPPFVRDAVMLFATERCFFALKGRDVKYRTMWNDAKQELYTPMSRGTDSVWDNAKYRLKRPDKKELDDFKIYCSKMNY